MSFYNTGNPVPSIDPRDLDDNAKVIDGFSNSTSETYLDRLGVSRRTLAGINNSTIASSVSVESVQSLATARQDVTQAVIVAAYHPGVYVLAAPIGNGGGVFHWSPNVPKASHNGGDIIDPLRAWPTDWSNESQKSAWYAAGVSGTGCFVRERDSTIFLEEFGVSTGITNNSKGMQKAFDSVSSEICNVSYKNEFSWSDTVFIDEWGTTFCGPQRPGQYHTGRRITFNGAADTWAIQVRAPGCVVRWNDARGGANRPNGVLWFRDQAMIPGNADIDGYLEENQLINFKSSTKFVGRSAFIRNNLFSLHTTGIDLQQFIYTSGVPEYYQTLLRGYRGFEITGNRFHASSGIDIRNMETGHENLYGCLLSANNHDTDGVFLQGSLNDSAVTGSLVHRLISSKIAFDMYRCRNVTFTGLKIGGEIGPLADATFAAAAFKFNTKEVSGLIITGNNISNVAGIPVQFVEPPEGAVNIDVNTWKDVSYNARAGAQTLPIVDIANVSADGRGTPAFSFQGNTLDLQPISSGATYGSLVRFTVRGAANGVINTMTNTVTAGGTIPETNLVTSATSLFKRRVPYVGNGSATQTIALTSNPEWIAVSPSSSGAANRFQTVIAEKGSTATNDVVELTETSVIVKGTYNTLNVVYGIVVY